MPGTYQDVGPGLLMSRYVDPITAWRTRVARSHNTEEILDSGRAGAPRSRCPHFDGADAHTHRAAQAVARLRGHL